VPTVAELQILLEARDLASPQLRRLGQDVQRLEGQVEQTSGAFGRLGGLFRGLGGLGLAGMGVGVVVSGLQSAVAAVGGLVTSASDLNEQLSRTGVVFGTAAGQVQDFARTTALALGISRTQALEAAGSFGTLFTASGLSEEAAAGMSTELVRLAADLASFNNLDPSDTLEKLRSGLVGEAEPLRAVGVLLNETQVKAKAAELGLGGLGRELTEAEKVQARYRLILEQTQRAQGDFARTSTGLANASRIIRAAFADIRTEIGQALLPTVARLAQAFVRQLPAITAAVQSFAAQVAPILERVFSGDIVGGLQEVAARLAPILASWSEAFWGWVREVGPPLLENLKALGGDLFAWIREQAPAFLERFIGEWVPAFVEWVVKVLPPLLVELGKILKALTDWATTTGQPQLEALGLALGAALVAGFGKALERLGPMLAEHIRTTLFPGGLPRLVTPGSPLAAQGANYPTPAQLPALSPEALRGAGGAPVVVDVGGVEVQTGADPQEAARQAGEAVAAEVLTALTRSAAVTDAGAAPALQGAR
jgi:hypothetical protein